MGGGAPGQTEAASVGAWRKTDSDHNRANGQDERRKRLQLQAVPDTYSQATAELLGSVVSPARSDRVQTPWRKQRGTAGPLKKAHSL